MHRPPDLSRRQLLRRLALGVPLAPLALRQMRAAVPGAQLPLLSVGDPAAKAVHYVENAAQAKGASPGSSCANCGLYQGVSGSTRGPCQLFPDKDVRAAGWCSSWAPQM